MMVHHKNRGAVCCQIRQHFQCAAFGPTLCTYLLRQLRILEQPLKMMKMNVPLNLPLGPPPARSLS